MSTFRMRCGCGAMTEFAWGKRADFRCPVCGSTVATPETVASSIEGMVVTKPITPEDVVRKADPAPRAKKGKKK